MVRASLAVCQYPRMIYDLCPLTQSRGFDECDMDQRSLPH